MKYLPFLLAVVLHQAYSQGCVDHYEYCDSYQRACHDDYYRHFLSNYCQKTCINYCSSIVPVPPVAGQCGVPQVQSSRVIAGDNATMGAWPWQILLLFNNKSICGGSLIAPNWVVTAAHCIYKFKDFPNFYKVRVGEHDIKVSEGNEQDIQVEKIIQYQGYDNYYLSNDLALLKLKTPARFGKYVSPVCLPKQGENIPVGTECFITGWGKIKHPGRMHPLLQQAKLPVVSNRVCERLNTRTTGIPVTKAMVCAGHGGATRLSGCHGDSGGPFVCRDKSSGSWVLHGAVSWGSRQCSAKQTYTVFARVSEFRNWIDQKIAQN